MKVLRVLVAILLLLLSAVLSSAQEGDQIVSKAFPASAVCRRNGQQRAIERQEAVNLGGSDSL